MTFEQWFPKLEVYTDGGCDNGGDRVGAWAWVAQDLREDCGPLLDVTNNIAEMTAVIEAIRANQDRVGHLIIVSDSQYVVKPLQLGWWRKWEAKGWMLRGNKPVKNRLLWEEILSLIEGRDYKITFKHVRGHSGHALNERADKLCTMTMREVRAA